MEIGICTFADIGKDPVTGEVVDSHKRLRNLMEEIELADQVGLDVFAIGEHHRPDYAVSAPAIIMAAAAERTKNIRLSSGVTVLSSDDPVRVFQSFSTVDLLSAGRAELMAGRGSFIESFPLFGYDLQDYDDLFAEKLEMLVQLNKQTVVSWKGKHTQSIDNRGIYPRPYNGQLPIWIAVGGTPESAMRAGEYGLPMMLAIIGGMPARFAPFTKLYRDVYTKSGHDVANFALGINSHTFIADDSKRAADEFYPAYAEVMTRIGRERGWPPTSRQQYDHSITNQGALLVGSPQQVTEKILYEYELFGHTRFLAQLGIGVMSHQKIMHAIELLGTKVAPEVRKHTASPIVTS